MDEDATGDDPAGSLAEDLARHRLVTLLGPAGIERSRIAAELAGRVRSAAADSVWWVDLAWTPAALVAERIAVTVGAPTDPRRPAEIGLVGHLADHRALLVLDGCDQVRGRCAELADLLRHRCPDVRLLATCCTPLSARGEVCASAGDAGAGVSCGTVSTAIHPPEGATVASRYERLAPAARLVLARLCAFRGGFTTDAAISVAQDLTQIAVRAACAELLAAGLVMTDLRPRTSATEQPRHCVPASVRRFVTEVDTETVATASRRHAAYWASTAAAAEAGLEGRDQARWLAELAQERDNLVAAEEWLIAGGEVEEALRMAGALGRFWWLSGAFDEGRRMLQTVLSQPGADQATTGRAAALHALGLATFWHETRAVEAHRSGAHFAEAVRIWRRLGQSAGLVRALRDLGAHLNSVGEAARARELLTESVTIARGAGDMSAVGVGLCYLGIVACYLAERVEARARLEEALVLLTGRGGDDELIRTQFFLACLECDDGNPVAGRARFAALVGGRRIIPALPYAEGFALDGLARLAVAEERFPDALRLSGAAAGAHERLGTSAGAAYARYVARGLDPARRECGDARAESYVEEGRRWPLAQAVEVGLAVPEPCGARLRDREVDVLRLVDAGLGDHEIARVLFLSPRTVGNHLSSAYRRLGVHSRTAAARVARRQGLL